MIGREDEVVQMADHQADIIHQLLKKERKETLLHKISSLPAQHRDIIVDFYLKEKIMNKLQKNHKLP